MASPRLHSAAPLYEAAEVDLEVEIRAVQLPRLRVREPGLSEHLHDFIRESPLVVGETRRNIPAQPRADVFVNSRLRARQLIRTAMEVAHLR